MSENPSLRLYCDFNDGDDHIGYSLLFHDGMPLADCITTLRLDEGDQVMLYQDEDDFEVIATLKRGRTRNGATCWVAVPDWATRRDLR